LVADELDAEEFDAEEFDEFVDAPAEVVEFISS